MPRKSSYQFVVERGGRSAPTKSKELRNPKVMSVSKIKLGIGIANTGSIHIDTAFCLLRMLKDFPYDYDVIFKRGSILHYSREEIVKKAVEMKCTHLLFVDTDMFFEKDAILKLLDRKKDVIGVNYYTRKEPKESTARLMDPSDYKGEQIYLAESVATGFMLIDLKVFKKIKEPWFFWGFSDKGEVTMGEDYWFCTKAREAGYEVWCDLSIPIGHIGEKIY